MPADARRWRLEQRWYFTDGAGGRVGAAGGAAGRFTHATADAVSTADEPGLLGVVGLDTHYKPSQPPVTHTTGPRVGSGPAGGYTPTELKTGYDVNPLASAGYTGSGQKIGLFELAGFKHHEHMCTVFKRQVGESPGSFRRRAQGESAPARKAP